MIPVEYKHNEEAHARGEVCAACLAALDALPVAEFTCPDCGGHREHYEETYTILVGWMTCLDCGYRKHGQSGKVEHGTPLPPK